MALLKLCLPVYGHGFPLREAKKIEVVASLKKADCNIRCPDSMSYKNAGLK